MASLYELNEQMEQVLSVLENSEDENTNEILRSALNQLECDKKTKVDNIVKWIRNLDSDIEALKNEEKRLNDKRKTIERKVENIKSYLFEFANQTEGKKIKGDLFEIGVRKNPASVVVVDETLIPSEFINVTEVRKVDKTALKNHIKLIGEVDGVELVQSESLRIK